MEGVTQVTENLSYVNSLVAPGIVAIIAGVFSAIGIYLKVRGDKGGSFLTESANFRADLLQRLEKKEADEARCWAKNAELAKEIGDLRLKVLRLEMQVEALNKEAGR